MLAASLELLLSTPRTAGLVQVLVVLALAAAACAPSLPVMPNASGAEQVAAATTSPSGQSDGAGTTAEDQATADSTLAVESASSAAPTTSVTTTTAITALADRPSSFTVGRWTLTGETRDESGSTFTASVTVPVLTAEADPVLLGRIATLIEGQVESQIGSTLALWRSIEEQGSRDISGSTLRLEFDVAGFEEDLISMRFFSDEQADGTLARRQVTTLVMDLTSGAAIALDDIIVGGAGRDALLSLVRDGLLVGYFDGDAEPFSLWAGDLTPADIDQVGLTSEGLEVWFDELEVGPPDIGMPVVTIAYADLDGIIDPAGPAAHFNR